MPQTIANLTGSLLRVTRRLGRAGEAAFLALLTACVLTLPALAATGFTDNGDGTVTDQATGLIWMRCAQGQTLTAGACTGTPTPYTWSQAHLLTNTVTFASKSDWRLPSVSELQTIVDSSSSNPAINTTAFPNAPSAVFWSDTADSNNAKNALYVNFIYGNASTLNQSNTFFARLVRGTATTTSGGGTTTGGTGTQSIVPSLASGWNMLGNDLNTNITVATLYADPTVITSVWKWDATVPGWQFYSPSATAASVGYAALTTIKPGEGYWVNAKSTATLTAQTGTPFSLAATNLVSGWNLVATADNIGPSDLNRRLSVTPPNPGVVPINFTSLWAWDNPTSNWYFYAPTLDANGTLASYVASKGYLNFAQAGKTLGNGVGFWVNSATPTAIVEPSSISVTLKDSTGAAVTALSSGASTTVAATVTDSAGAAVANAIVTFSTDATFGTIAPTTALTNAAGVATATISPAGTAGASTVSATTQVGTATLSGSKGYTVSAAVAATTVPRLTLALTNNAGAAVTNLSVGTATTVTATVKDAAGAAVPSAIVSFSTDTAIGTISPATALTNAAGVATVTITPAGAAGASAVTASTKVGTATVTGSVGYTTAATGITIALTDQTGAAVSTLAAGSTTTVTATVKDATGTAIPNVIVTFATNTTFATINPATALTNAAGIATATITPAGTSGASAVTATAQVGTATISGTKSYTTAASATIQLLTGSPQMPSSGAATVDLTAIVLSATKQAVGGTTVTFSTGTDSSAFINNISASGISDANGIVTAKLNLGGNKANRKIAISAAANSGNASTSVDVTGTAITISGSNSLTFGGTTELTFNVKDAAGTAIPGVTITVTSDNGNTIALDPATNGTTDSSGTIKAVVTGAASGSDKIRASAAGASAIQDITVSPDSFTFNANAPAKDQEINLGAAQTVSVTWTSGGVAQQNKTVTFSSSRGVITSSALTNAAGVASVTITSANTAGPAIITAAAPGGSPAASIPVLFVATTATSVTPQAVPGTVAYTTGSTSQTNNSANITAVVRDSNNNLVKNAAVSFQITADPTQGKLLSNNVLTDANGSASVTYIAGGTSSGLSGVNINATVTSVNGVTLGAPITGTTKLTVAGQANLVRLGTDNKVGVSTNTPTYTKTWVATVTDTAGNPVPNATVRFDLVPTRFRKGYYVWSSANGLWIPQPSSPGIYCANEDVLFTGIIGGLNVDTNGNSMLDPGGAANVTASSVTDSSGNAIAVITYPKDHAGWAEYALEARTGVVGNDPPTKSLPFWLDGLATDYSTQSVSPPGQPSPYGSTLGTAGTLCSNTN